VEPRYGRLYANAVLRPFAEQLVAALDVRPGETTCDLMSDSGTLGVALGAAVGRRGLVLLVDTDAALLAAAAGDVAATGCAVSTAIADARGVAVAGASCDRIAALCTTGFWPAPSLLDEAERIVRPAGKAAVLTWDITQPPVHEAALADALRDVAGIRSQFLARCLQAPPISERPRWNVRRLRDVVRFDGIGQYWMAMVAERPVAAELARLSEEAVRAARATCEVALRQFTAADGTMRIPVTATLLHRASDGR
jgi:SAM-dependent methyltransferase